MKICVVGAGYVGLATGVMFGKLGHDVVVADIDRFRVKTVNSGHLPFFEPPLEKELKRLVDKDRLVATADVGDAVIDARFVFICVQTPSLPSGRIDIRPVKSASRTIAKALAASPNRKTVVMKSTVVPSTTDSMIKPILEKYSGLKAVEDFGLGMNPEFLQEGSALRDSMEPSRIVIGSEDRRTARELLDLYRPIKSPKIVTDIRSAEMIKYASNTFLATKISYSNEIANMCERFGIDSRAVLEAVGMDPRVGPLFLNPGLGFGGSCLPKDVKALRDKARQEGYSSVLLSSLMSINDRQPLEGIRLLEGALGSLDGKRIAVLGLAFKGGVDDTRDTRAVPLVTGLLAKRAQVIAFDPMAMANFIKLVPSIRYAASLQECLRGVDGCIVQADWPEFRRMGEKEFKLMRNPVVVDGRRCLDPEKVSKAGARYFGIGYGRSR